MKLNCKGDYDLLEKWLEKHKNASIIKYDTQTQLPVEAIYKNPIYTAYVEEPNKFWAEVNIL